MDKLDKFSLRQMDENLFKKYIFARLLKNPVPFVLAVCYSFQDLHEF